MSTCGKDLTLDSIRERVVHVPPTINSLDSRERVVTSQRPPCCDCCEIEATVVTGFELMAKEEIEEKLGITASTNRGCVNMVIPLKDVKQVI